MPTNRPKPRKHSPRRRPAPARTARPARPKVAHSDDESQPTGESGERLQKVIAAAGIASRRECEQLILDGRVEVDRKTVTELGTRVDPEQQEIRVDGEALSRQKLVYFAINKPTGVVCTARDPAGRDRVTDLMPPNSPRVFCVGRLDIASEGLILVTNDGELANGLTHPRHGVEKIYHVKVAGRVENSVLAQLHRGVHLAEGYAHVKHVRIKSHQKKSTVLEMVLDEGRNREVRRLLARVGHKVQQLRRVAVGPVRLGDLPIGAVRPLSPKEVRALELAVTHSRPDNQPSEKAAAPAAKLPAKPSVKPRTKNKAPHKAHKASKEGRTVIG